MKLSNRILIVRTDRIGDVVLSLPLSKIIKENLSETRVYFLLRAYTKDLAFNHPYIDELLVLKERKGSVKFWENLRMLRKYSFDSCLVVYPTFRIALLLFLSGIRKRIGTGYRWYSFLFNKRIYEHRKYGTKHELEFNLNMLEMLGIQREYRTDVSFDLQIKEDATQRVVGILKEKGVSFDKPIVIFHPGSGGSAVDLPLSKFKELILKISRSFPADILLTGSLLEKELCEELVLHEEIVNLAGCLSLGELVSVISISELLVANSTGPIHIAAALGKYVIGFYPKIPECSPVRWGPYTEKKIIFSPTIGCNNCTRKQCEELNCMNSISMDDVELTIKKILKG